MTRSASSPRPGGEHRCNIWQGRFPAQNTADDGYTGTAPVDAYPPNGYGLFNVAGNVWEWCEDRWSAPGQPPGRGDDAERVMRGGSYLCHESYCNRYRVAARTRNASGGRPGHRPATVLTPLSAVARPAPLPAFSPGGNPAT
jgi:sulfatase modifying factor 1